VKLEEPTGLELPPEDFASEKCRFPSSRQKMDSKVTHLCKPNFDRLQLLESFPKLWRRYRLERLEALIKAKGNVQLTTFLMLGHACDYKRSLR